MDTPGRQELRMVPIIYLGPLVHAIPNRRRSTFPSLDPRWVESRERQECYAGCDEATSICDCNQCREGWLPSDILQDNRDLLYKLTSEARAELETAGGLRKVDLQCQIACIFSAIQSLGLPAEVTLESLLK